MTEKKLYFLWGALFILCAALGFIPEPQGFLKVLLVLVSTLFFIPGFWLLYRAVISGKTEAVGHIRLISLVSLGGTLVFLVLNFLSAAASEATGSFLYSLLVIVSTPMVCSQYWVLSLFLWAFLLTASISLSKKRKNN